MGPRRDHEDGPFVRAKRDLDTIPGDPRFKDFLWHIALLHSKKQEDYGKDKDPFANVRAATDFGVNAWVGCAIRMNDKMRRLMTAAKKGKLANESVEDSFDDLAVYAGIGKILYEEEHATCEGLVFPETETS